MAYLTDRSYDLRSNGDMAPDEDPRRQVSRTAAYDPATMVDLGTGIMGGDTAGGRAQSGQYARAAHDRQLNAQRRNKTLDFLRKNHPDLVDMVEAGLPVAEAWQRLMAGWRSAERQEMGKDHESHQLEQPGAERRTAGSTAMEPLQPVVFGDQLAPFAHPDAEPAAAESPRRPDTEVRPVFGAEGGVRLYKPMTREAFDAMPSGAFYLDPGDGAVYRKL